MLRAWRAAGRRFEYTYTGSGTDTVISPLSWTLGTNIERGLLTGRSFAQDYFPYGGMVGTLRLQMPKALGDRVAVMDNGRVVHAGSMRELADDEALQQRLLGLSLGVHQ